MKKNIIFLFGIIIGLSFNSCLEKTNRRVYRFRNESSSQLEFAFFDLNDASKNGKILLKKGKYIDFDFYLDGLIAFQSNIPTHIDSVVITLENNKAIYEKCTNRILGKNDCKSVDKSFFDLKSYSTINKPIGLEYIFTDEDALRAK